MKFDDIDGEYSYTLHQSGQASTLPAGEEDDGEARIRQLHAVVHEITGKPVDRPARPRIGFLP